ncbi:MAG TPA: hypothetical protein VNR87_15750 [Flavisolibacter sp.]|nr:hypothetical protein [Flavisolibacter sp.]
MSFELSYIFTFSILVGGLLGIFRFNNIRQEFYPFIFLIWLACINEVLGLFLVLSGHYNIINNNVYSLFEALLLLWFFKRIGTIQRQRVLYPYLLSLIVLTWVADNFIFHYFGENFNSYFNIICSFTVVLLAISTINEILISDDDILKNPVFLICAGIVIFFTYMILVEAFWISGPRISKNFRRKVFEILYWINFFCNLIYALAILWMRKKQAFTLQF